MYIYFFDLKAEGVDSESIFNLVNKRYPDFTKELFRQLDDDEKAFEMLFHNANVKQTL